MEWTYATVAAFAADTPGLGATLDRLLQNQTDLGNAIKPFYGKKAGNALTKLLRPTSPTPCPCSRPPRPGTRPHCTTRSPPGRPTPGTSRTSSRPRTHTGAGHEMRMMMVTHIDQTVAYAAAQLTGHYARSIRLYGHAEQHMLRMADMLSDGIIAQFPRRF